MASFVQRYRSFSALPAIISCLIVLLGLAWLFTRLPKVSDEPVSRAAGMAALVFLGLSLSFVLAHLFVVLPFVRRGQTAWGAWVRGLMGRILLLPFAVAFAFAVAGLVACLFFLMNGVYSGPSGWRPEEVQAARLFVADLSFMRWETLISWYPTVLFLAFLYGLFFVVRKSQLQSKRTS